MRIVVALLTLPGGLHEVGHSGELRVAGWFHQIFWAALGELRLDYH